MKMSKLKNEGKPIVSKEIIDPNAKPKYEQIWVVQTAINMAIAENRVVRFLSDKSNAQLKSEIENLKGCLVRKADRDSNDVAVIPPGIESFSFEDVDTAIAMFTPRGSKTPNGIYIP
jgi:hypothetical protein